MSDVALRIEAYLPCEWAEDWDNVGLILGDPEAEIRRVAVALDPFPSQILKAAENKCDLLITHHPPLFHPLNRIILNNRESRALALALAKGVALYAAHTNWDSSPVGVNRVLSNRIKLIGLRPLVESATASWGLGAVGFLDSPVCLDVFMSSVRRLWGLSHVRFWGEPKKEVHTVALCGGAGGSFWKDAHRENADVYLTADMGYHVLSEAVASGLAVGLADHGEMERLSMACLADYVAKWTGLDVCLLDEAAPPPAILLD